ncbi:hypothetical protein LIER_12392 [Lithospermum erythrorhizon]|uniref:Glycosyl transferase CAP10 domain-containing protein n=1 Tax=Lithospermum erythrorhizon TaxID=34254 RepID=A0AAV3PVP2_LITER
MRNHHQEKLANEFWLRPALQRNSFATKWRYLNKQTYVTTPLIIFSFFFLIFILVFGGWIDLANFSGQVVSLGAFESSIKKPEIPIEYPMNCTSWSETNKCPSNDYPRKHQPSKASSNSTCPEYFKWIYEDLKQWKETGITKEMVDRAQKHAHFRLVILDGKIYVEKFRQSIQSRALFTTWGLVQLMRFYPGKLPDLELMFDCDDRPVIRAKDYTRPNAAAPPPVFRYCSNAQSLDIVFPDWSFWGW